MSLLSEVLTQKRCVHCRSELPPFTYHCPTCGRTVAEEIPSEPYTVELRITHNPTGKMLVLQDYPYSRDTIDEVDLRRLLRPFQRALGVFLDRYPEHEEPPKADLSNLPGGSTLESVRKWTKSLKEQIRAHRDTIKTVSGDNLPSASAVLEHAQEVKRQASRS